VLLAYLSFSAKYFIPFFPLLFSWDQFSNPDVLLLSTTITPHCLLNFNFSTTQQSAYAGGKYRN
jgi:hypothetical protein